MLPKTFGSTLPIWPSWNMFKPHLRYLVIKHGNGNSTIHKGYSHSNAHFVRGFPGHVSLPELNLRYPFYSQNQSEAFVELSQSRLSKPYAPEGIRRQLLTLTGNASKI